jgi:hypothetical protein
MARSPDKKFGFRFGTTVQRLAEGFGGCIATDMVAVDALPVGYMYREEPDNEQDSGWRFTAGRETPEYMDNADHHSVFDVNTIANHDPDIIPLLGAPPGTAFERQGRAGKFVQVAGEPWQPGARRQKQWPPPGVPLVQGTHALNDTWSIRLPGEFARRVEDDSLVLWRPGLTMWLAIWNNNRGESQAKRLAAIKAAAAKGRHSEREETSTSESRYSYRLRDENEDGPIESLNAFILTDQEHLQIAVYFDDPATEAAAGQLVESIHRS